MGLLLTFPTQQANTETSTQGLTETILVPFRPPDIIDPD